MPANARKGTWQFTRTDTVALKPIVAMASQVNHTNQSAAKQSFFGTVALVGSLAYLPQARRFLERKDNQCTGRSIFHMA